MFDLSTPQGAHADQRLHTDTLIWLSSVRPDGNPHLVPVWFLWDDSTILIFSKPRNQKLRNILNNPNVTLALQADADGGNIVIVEGKAALIDGINATLSAYVQKYSEDIKGIGSTPESMAAEYSQAIRITPTHLLSW